MSNYRKFLGEKITYYRKSMNLSRAELAEAIGISSSYLGLVERGKRGISVQHLIEISNLFDISINNLLSEDETTIDKEDLFIRLMSRVKSDEKELLSKIATLLVISPDSENHLETIKRLVKYYLEYKIKKSSSKIKSVD